MWLYSQSFPLNSFQTLPILPIGLFQTLKFVSKHIIKVSSRCLNCQICTETGGQEKFDVNLKDKI